MTENRFDDMLPEDLRKVSKIHFTPVPVAQEAALWLTEDGQKRVLDVGAGVGKFCVAGATVSDSFFYGIEYRPSLVKMARDIIEVLGLTNALVEERNILDFDFSTFDAFYMYNPFYENIVYTKRLNNEVPLADSLFRAYVRHTALQLNERPPGTRLVSYHGDNLEIPMAYEMVKSSRKGLLKFWIKKQ